MITCPTQQGGAVWTEDVHKAPFQEEQSLELGFYTVRGLHCRFHTGPRGDPFHCRIGAFQVVVRANPGTASSNAGSNASMNKVSAMP